MENKTIMQTHTETLQKLIDERKTELRKELDSVIPIKDIREMIVESTIENEQYYILKKYKFNWNYLLKTQRKNMPDENIMKHFFFDMEYYQIEKYFKVGAMKNNHKFIEVFLKYREYIMNNRTKNQVVLDNYLTRIIIMTANKYENISIKKITSQMEELVKLNLLDWVNYVNYGYNHRFIAFDKKNVYKIRLYLTLQNLLDKKFIAHMNSVIFGDYDCCEQCNRSTMRQANLLDGKIADIERQLGF